MSEAMKRLIREMMGHRDGNFHFPPKDRALLVTNADMTAARKLAEIGVIEINHVGRGYEARRVSV